MRKYLFSGGVLGALFGLIGLIPRTIAGPRNLRLVLAWAAWAISAVAAVVAVREASEESSEYFALRDQERAQHRSR